MDYSNYVSAKNKMSDHSWKTPHKSVESLYKVRERALKLISCNKKIANKITYEEFLRFNDGYNKVRILDKISEI